VEGARRSSQHLLYATSPGQKAYETSLGIFTSVLLEGLDGKGVEMTFAQATRTFQVRFPKLAKYVIERVSATVARKIPQNAAQSVQVPQQQTLGDSADPVLVELPENAVGNYPVRVRVSPTNAREQCRVSAQIYLPRLPQPVEYAGEGPPAPLPVKFELPPQDYSICASAAGFEDATAPCALYKASEVELTLPPKAKPLSRPPTRGPLIGLAPLIGLGPLEARATPDPPPEEPTTGRLEIRSDDPMAELLVHDATGATILRGRGAVSGRLAQGLYRVQLVGAGRVRSEELVEVRAGRENQRRIAAPSPRLGKTQLALLRDLGMVREGSAYVYTSDSQGLADTRLGSLLAFAAFAAASATKKDTADLAFLRKLGIGFPKTSPAVLSLVGASGDAPLPGLSPADLVNETSLVVFDGQQRKVAQYRHQPLERFPVAAQRVIPLEPGGVVVRLALPGLEPTHFALACLPGRVTVFIVVLNDDGSIDAQQYLIPAADAPHTPHPELTRLTADNLRRVELVQRSYAKSAEVPADVVADLLGGKWIDPLMACAAGYALLRRGDREGFKVAAKNMLEHFDGLPDTHVLAAMEWPKKQDQHFADAARRGTPVFAEGFRALQRWREEQAQPGPPETLDIAEGLLPSSPWTAWVLNRPALAVHDDGSLDAAALGWEILEAEEERIAQVARSVGRVEVGGASGRTLAFRGTGFLIEPGLVVVPGVLLEGAREGNVLRVPVHVTFAARPRGTAKRFPVREIAGIDEATGLLRLRIDDGGTVPPLRRADTVPGAYTAIYIVSYPWDWIHLGKKWRPPKRFDGTKRVSPGRLIGEADARGIIRHDCATGPGSAGGAVIDLATHCVLGLHESSELHDELKIGAARLL
jgi:hypothetical protein